VLLFELRFGKRFTFCVISRHFAEGGSKMENISGKAELVSDGFVRAPPSVS
jgi:hypothetical protein